MFRNTIPGSLTEIRWRCSRVGTPIQGCSWMVQAWRDRERQRIPWTVEFWRLSRRRRFPRRGRIPWRWWRPWRRWPQIRDVNDLTKEKTKMKTIHQCVSTISRHLGATAVPRAILALGIAGGLSLALAQQSAQPTFPSAGAATQSLSQAVQNND